MPVVILTHEEAVTREHEDRSLWRLDPLAAWMAGILPQADTTALDELLARAQASGQQLLFPEGPCAPDGESYGASYIGRPYAPTHKTRLRAFLPTGDGSTGEDIFLTQVLSLGTREVMPHGRIRVDVRAIPYNPTECLFGDGGCDGGDCEDFDCDCDSDSTLCDTHDVYH